MLNTREKHNTKKTRVPFNDSDDYRSNVNRN